MTDNGGSFRSSQTQPSQQSRNNDFLLASPADSSVPQTPKIVHCPYQVRDDQSVPRTPTTRYRSTQHSPRSTGTPRARTDMGSNLGQGQNHLIGPWGDCSPYVARSMFDQLVPSTPQGLVRSQTSETRNRRDTNTNVDYEHDSSQSQNQHPNIRENSNTICNLRVARCSHLYRSDRNVGQFNNLDPTWLGECRSSELLSSLGDTSVNIDNDRENPNPSNVQVFDARQDVNSCFPDDEKEVDMEGCNETIEDESTKLCNRRRRLFLDQVLYQSEMCVSQGQGKRSPTNKASPNHRKTASSTQDEQFKSFFLNDVTDSDGMDPIKDPRKQVFYSPVTSNDHESPNNASDTCNVNIDNGLMVQDMKQNHPSCVLSSHHSTVPNESLPVRRSTSPTNTRRKKRLISPQGASTSLEMGPMSSDEEGTNEDTADKGDSGLIITTIITPPPRPVNEHWLMTAAGDASSTMRCQPATTFTQHNETSQRRSKLRLRGENRSSTSNNKSQPIDDSNNKSQPIDASSNKGQPIDASTNKSQPIDVSSNKSQPIDASTNKSQPIDASNSDIGKSLQQNTHYDQNTSGTIHFLSARPPSAPSNQQLELFEGDDVFA